MGEFVTLPMIQMRGDFIAALFGEMERDRVAKLLPPVTRIGDYVKSKFCRIESADMMKKYSGQQWKDFYRMYDDGDFREVILLETADFIQKGGTAWNKRQ